VEIARCDHNTIVDGGTGAVYLLPANRSLFPNPGDIHGLLTALHYFSNLPLYYRETHGLLAVEGRRRRLQQLQGSHCSTVTVSKSCRASQAVA
jgi:hypothetical protein